MYKKASLFSPAPESQFLDPTLPLSLNLYLELPEPSWLNRRDYWRSPGLSAVSLKASSCEVQGLLTSECHDSTQVGYIEPTKQDVYSGCRNLESVLGGRKFRTGLHENLAN